MSEKFYRAKLKCDACGKETWHFYVELAWRCRVCDRKSGLSDALSDVAKAASKVLDRLSPPATQEDKRHE